MGAKENGKRYNVQHDTIMLKVSQLSTESPDVYELDEAHREEAGWERVLYYGEVLANRVEMCEKF
ncbi:hypothetical protein ZHAS_00000398 [Anopheles sinensis]|uniref:Uncharacterized protein n=1 Tax=Anopheles sinensis TaxID=74873 RepID=A0A084VA60_ANOSI|nr:hypothetical protein ZHAS_00000398 [Anopheles sinensis]